MKTLSLKRAGRTWLVLSAVFGFGVGVPVASAVVVARETTVTARPTVRAPTEVTTVTPRPGVAVAPAGATVVRTLPAGCVTTSVGGVSYRKCGTTLYRPYMEGDHVSYVAVR